VSSNSSKKSESPGLKGQGEKKKSETGVMKKVYKFLGN